MRDYLKNPVSENEFNEMNLISEEINKLGVKLNIKK